MKNRGYWNTLFLAVLAGSLLIAAPAWSQGPGSMPAPPDEFDFEPGEEVPGFMPEPIFELEGDENLSLTDEQKATLHELRQTFQKGRIAAQAEAKIQRMELRELMGAENPDRTAIAKKLDQMAQARTAQALAGFDHRQEMQAVFTPDQLAKMKEMRKNRRAHRRMGRAGNRLGRQARRGMRRGAHGARQGMHGARRGLRGQHGRRGQRGGHDQMDCPCAMGADGHGEMRGHGDSKEGAPEGHGNTPE